MSWSNKTATPHLTADLVRELWSQTYNREGKPDWSHIFPYYHEDIVFQDSIQRIEGIDAFVALCDRLTRRCEQIDMDIHAVVMKSCGIFLWRDGLSNPQWLRRRGICSCQRDKTQS